MTLKVMAAGVACALAQFVPAPMAAAQCEADGNYDGAVDSGDLNGLLAEFGAPSVNYDFNGTGAVDSADLNTLLAEFGAECPPPVFKDISSRTLEGGDVVMVTGENLPPFENLCVVAGAVNPGAGDGGQAPTVAFRAIGGTDKELMLEVAPIPPGVTEGKLVAMVGNGTTTFDLNAPDVEVIEPGGWVWGVQGDPPSAELPGTVNFVEGAADGPCNTFDGGWDGGVLSVVVCIPDPCVEGTTFDYWVRGRWKDEQFWFDENFPIQFTLPAGSAEFCAISLCESVEKSLEAKFPTFTWSCSPSNLGDGKWRLVVIPPVEWGTFFDPDFSYNKFQVTICEP